LTGFQREESVRRFDDRARFVSVIVPRTLRERFKALGDVPFHARLAGPVSAAQSASYKALGAFGEATAELANGNSGANIPMTIFFGLL